MRKSLPVLLALSLIFSIGCSRKEVPENKVIMLHANIDTTVPVFYRVGQIEAGSTAEFRFNLKNTRQSAVLVTEARSFCGCTIPEYTPEPVLPGKYTTVKVTFLAEHLGIFDKVVRVFLNHREDPVELRLTGEVIRNKQARVHD